MSLALLSIRLKDDYSDIVEYRVLPSYCHGLDLGARKLGIISITPVGCCSSQRSLNATGDFLEQLNDDAKLDVLMHKLSSVFKDSKHSLLSISEEPLVTIEKCICSS